MSDLINLEVHEVVYRDESGAFLAGYACATHKSILSTIFTHHSNEFVKVHKSLYEEDPPPGHCCFVPKKIERNLNEEAFILSMTDECLYVTARHAAKYAVISGSTDSKLWSGTKRTRSMSSMSSGSTANDSICEKSMQTPATALGKASVVGNGDGIVTEIKAAGTSSSRSTQSKPYKTPNAVVTTQPNISAKDKAAVQFNIPERKGVLASTIPWKAPVPNSSIVGEGKLSEEIIMQSIYNLKRSCKWSVHYGEKAHLKPIENQVFVIPYGRYSEKSTSRGFENIEYFTEKSHFVAHIQRNPSITYDFKNVWSKLEKQGWQRDSPSSSSGSDFRIRFPAATTVNTSLMPRTVDGSPIQNVKGIHNFNSQAALHLYIMKFPYPLQEDAVLVDTLKGMGWTCQTSQPGRFCHPLFPVHKSASLQEVRHLLWTDPSLLAARAYKNVSVSAQIDVSSCLRAAFKILDEANLVDPAEVEEGSDFDDKSVRDILAIVEKHIGTETEMNAKSGGVWWQFSKEEIEELESLLVNGCGWRIEKHGSPESSDWWKHFKAYFPDFDGLIPTGSPSSRRKGQRKSYIPGVSIFWCLDDVLKYLQTYGNVSPVNVDSVLPNLRVNLAASPQPDYKSIISSETFDLVSDFHSIFYTLLDENWSMVMIKPTSVKELYPTLKNEEEITCVFAASWVKGLSPDGMFDPKSHVKDRDFFIFKESVINYLKRFGNFYVSASKFNKATGDGNKICGNRARQYQLISSDDACTEFVTFVGETCEIRAKNEINHLLSDELGVRHVTARVIELLEDIGWRNTWGTDNYKNFNADNIFFAPWVQKEIPAASEMTLNVDYFMRQKDVIDFVKRHGFNKPTSSAQKASSKRSTKVAIDLIPAAPKSIVVPNEVKVNTKSASKSPTRKLKKGVIPTRPSTIKQVAVNSTPPGRTMSESEKELREIIESPSGNYKCRRIMDTLLEMGWREGVKANFAKYHSEYIILPPWGSVHFDFESEGRESVFPMVSNVHFFNNIKDVEVYVVKYGNQESEAAALEEVHGRRRRSQKPAVPSTTKKSLNIKSLKAPKRKLPKEDDVDKMEVEASEEHASVEESSEEGEEESSEEEEDKDEEEDYVDPYPALSDSGEEGSLKEALIANPTKYPTEVMRPFLEEWGWMLQVKADASLYFKDYIILAPWATNQFSYEEFGKASILTLVHGADYFREISEARDYVLMHGNREMAEDEKVALLNDSGRRKRSTAPQPAPVTTTAVVKGKSKAKRESSKTGNKRSQPEKIKNKSPTSSKRSKKKDMCTDSIDNKAPSADCNEEEFSYTQSIKLFEAECSEQADEPLPEVDNDCSTEIIEIVRASLKDRPRLNPSSFKCVMSVLRVYGWSYLYSNSVGASEIYHRPRLSIKKSNLSEFKEGRDYFQSQEDVLEFVKNQILARKGNYDNIAEKAIFCPDDDFADDDDELLEAVADEDHIKLKLPTGSLYQSSEPYVSSFDALTSHDAVGDDNEEEEDDIPIGVFGNVDEADDSYIADAEICDGKEVVVDSSTSDTQALGDDDDFFSYSCTADVLDGDSLSSTLTQIESQTQAQVESFKDIEIEAEQSQSIMSPSPVDKCESLESTSVGQKRKLSPIKNQRVLATNEASPLSKKVRSPKRASIAIIPGSSISNSKSKPASLNRGVTVSPNALRFRSNSVSRNPSPNSDKGYIPTNKPHTSPKKASPSVEASPSKVSTSHLRISTGPINSVPASSILPLNVVLTRVKARLQASYTPAKVLHREAEYEKIRDATKGSLLAGQGTTILVAGQPGQGKTLCVKHVISSLTGDTEVEQFSKLFLKGSDFSGGFKFLAKELGIEGLYSEVAAENAVKEYFCVSNKSRDVERLLLVIDEIDMVPSSFRQSLLTLTKTDSRVVLIGLANDLSTETYNTEVVFEVYTESQILDILKSLTENLFDDKGATMIAKTCTAEGDIRPVTTLALTCLELVQSQLALSETGKEELVKPAYPVVTLRIASLAKSQCRGLDMKDKLQSISKGAVLTLVSLALQYHVGDIFSFSEIVDLSNTHLEALKLQRCTGAEVEGHTQELLNNCFMHEVHSSKKQASSPHNAKFTLGINATDLLQENCRSILFAQNWNELEQSIKIRNA